MPHEVFISYSVKDKPIADATCAFLEASGIQCWIAPRDVLPGREYAEELVSAISQCRLMVLILSSSSNHSPQVLREVERAVSKGVPIIPVRIEDVHLSPSMEYFVSAHHWLDAVTPPIEHHLSGLADTVSKLITRPVTGTLEPPPAHSAVSLQPGPPSPATQQIAQERREAASISVGLDELSEDEYGGGTELTSTGFLVFGILTLWIYTVHVYYGAIRKHLEARLSHFLTVINEGDLTAETKKKLEGIRKEGFALKARVRNASIGLYCFALALLAAFVVTMHLLGAGLIKESFFNPFALITTCFLVFSFCLASILFLSWVVKTIKRHEYNELLLFRLSRHPGEFKAVSPSADFVKRWSQYQNWVTLFLVVSVPMTFSPALAAFHVLTVVNRAGDYETAVILWSAVIFLFGLLFHVWGIKLLLAMYNDHLQFERSNRS